MQPKAEAAKQFAEILDKSEVSMKEAVDTMPLSKTE